LIPHIEGLHNDVVPLGLRIDERLLIEIDEAECPQRVSAFRLIRTTFLKSRSTYVRIRPNWLIGALYSPDLAVAVVTARVTSMITSGKPKAYASIA